MMSFVTFEKKVQVDVDITEDELIDALEDRGYVVLVEDDYTNLESEVNPFTDEELDIIAKCFAGAEPGTEEYEIYQKTRKL